MEESNWQSRRDFLKQLGIYGFGAFALNLLGRGVLAKGDSFSLTKAKTLTNEHFVLANSCPTKLYYFDKKTYANKTLENPFMEALGEGGFQVSALARFYHPDGIELAGISLDQAVQATSKLINTKDNVTIFSGEVIYKDLRITPDILIIEGDKISIVEVKAKIFYSTTKEPFRTKKGKIRKGWQPHLFDIAYQKYVLEKAYPKLKVEAYLMMADKSKTCPTDKLNQKFKIIKDKKGTKTILNSPDLSKEDRSVEILSKINVDDYCRQIFEDTYDVRDKTYTFSQMVEFFAEQQKEDKKIKPKPASICRNCEFRTSAKSDNESKQKDGFKECWTESLGWKEKDFDEPNILSLWDFRQKDRLIEAGRIKLKDVKKSDINIKTRKGIGLSRTERQWLQVEKLKDNDQTPFIDKENLKYEMDSWTYPLHFIDFETSAPAIPFIKGMKPYEGIAFQYSHHIVYKDGRIEQKGEFLNANPGEFPSFKFIRALKKELENDNGSIFRYSSHENTYLNYIYRQLKSSVKKIDDRDELCDFIKTITQSTGSSKEKWFGKRNMIDLWRLVKLYYYDPHTNGSNSIKQVLPAILNSSTFLQEKYSKPIYGTKELPSLNFKDWTWLKKEDEKIIDPYKLLPKMFQDLSEKDVKLLSSDNTLGDGGAALTAYGRLQFEEMSDYERTEIKKALLKYCELDTFAMVLIYEGWKDLLNK